MHDDIKRFSLEGQVLEANLAKYKDFLVGHIEIMMRDQGFVPVLDIDPQFTLDYIREYEKYNFILTVYGAPVDRDMVWSVGGTMGGKLIMKYTPKSKSNRSSTKSA